MNKRNYRFAIPAVLAMLVCLWGIAPLWAAETVPYGDGNIFPGMETEVWQLKGAYASGSLPLGFRVNNGRGDRQARFYARCSHYYLWLTEKGMIFDFFESGAARDRWSLIFVGASDASRLKGVRASQLRVNYLKGNDRSQWRSVAVSQAVVYKSLYPRIDLKVYGIQREVQYEWIVKPGGDPSVICIDIKDVLDTGIDAGGNLLTRTAFGEALHKKPRAFQPPNISGVGKSQPVTIRFKAVGGNRYGFHVGQYDPSRPLIIEPVVRVR